MSCIHSDDRVTVDDATNACVNTGEPFRVRFRVTRANDGALRWFDARGEAVYEENQRVRVNALADDRTACAEAGMDDYLAKPLRLADLDLALGKAASGAQPTRRQGD